jgi:fatty acid desaturase
MSAQNHTSELNFKIDTKDLKPLFATQSHKHALGMVYNWLVIIGMIVLCSYFFHPLLYLVSVIVIGARMHALAILMHDATHFRFLKNRKWNDILTNWLCMYPLFSDLATYRQNHLRHHRHLNTDDDPDWVNKLGKKDFSFPKSKREFITTVLSYFLLYKGVKDAVWFLKRFNAPKKKSNKKGKLDYKRLAFYVILALVLTLTNGWKMVGLYWLVPYFSTFFMLQYIRSVAEHFGELAYDHLLTSSRTVKANAVERFLIAPHNVGYHLEHHLYPAVPFYNLPKLHQLLMETEEYKGKAHITSGYLKGLLSELGEV